MEAHSFNETFDTMSLEARFEVLKSLEKTVFSTSFGSEDQYITHLLKQYIVEADLFTLDTGRLFNETYAVWAETEKTYNLKIKGYFPKAEDVLNYQSEYGINGFYDSIEARKSCCNMRKVVPLLSAIERYDYWISGLRRAQSDNRKDLPFAEYDKGNNIVKIYPLADLSDEALNKALNTHNIPVNSLVKQGFLSIGCAPCTRATQEGEPARAGRWWWEQDAQECGLHFVRGKRVKSKDLE